MSNNFIHEITVDSFGYEFYGSTGAVQLNAVLSAQTSVSISENVDFYLNEELSANFNAQFSVATVVIVTAGINVNIITQASALPVLVVPASASIIASFGIELYSLERFNSSIIEDSFNIRPFFMIDDLPLSEHNRTTSSSTQILNVSNSNWKGAKSIYYKKNGVKRTFTFQWKMLPGKRDNTVDNNLGRNGVIDKANDPSVHTLEIKNLDTDGLTPYTTEVYNVLVTEYSETLIRRDLVGDDYYWDCNLSLQEV